ncbi:unnamed protein product, partial [Allacma fusca]
MTTDDRGGKEEKKEASYQEDTEKLEDIS